MAYINTAINLSLMTQSKCVGEIVGFSSLSRSGTQALSSQLLPHLLGPESFNKSSTLARDDKYHFYWQSMGKD